MQGVARISWRSLSTRTVLGRRSGGDPFADIVFQRDNAFVDAAFQQLIDVASRRLKLRRLHPQLKKSTARPVFRYRAPLASLTSSYPRTIRQLGDADDPRDPLGKQCPRKILHGERAFGVLTARHRDRGAASSSLTPGWKMVPYPSSTPVFVEQLRNVCRRGTRTDCSYSYWHTEYFTGWYNDGSMTIGRFGTGFHD